MIGEELELVFLANIYDPSRLDWWERQKKLGSQTESQARRWLVGKIIGEPKIADVPNAVGFHDLKGMGLVGVYELRPKSEAK